MSLFWLLQLLVLLLLGVLLSLLDKLDGGGACLLLGPRLSLVGGELLANLE